MVGFECYGCIWAVAWVRRGIGRFSVLRYGCIRAAAWVRRGIGRFSMLRDNGLGSPEGGHGAGQALLLMHP